MVMIMKMLLIVIMVILMMILMIVFINKDTFQIIVLHSNFKLCPNLGMQV